MPFTPRLLREFIGFIEIHPTHAVVGYYLDESNHLIPLVIGHARNDPRLFHRALIVWVPTVHIYELWTPSHTEPRS